MVSLGEVLLSFRIAIVSSDGILLQWRPEDPDPCKCRGVKCAPKSKRVTNLRVSLITFLAWRIALHNNNFYGKIPSELENHTELQRMSHNVL
ncbi:hypothetical protein K1719_008778 [Acacia pycnantha]|nr:hypothetical protein K1719_008778 [Acacia pycnantha]